MTRGEQDEFIKAHYGGDLSAKQIAEHLGLTKNQIVGRASRLGLKRTERNPIKRIKGAVNSSTRNPTAKRAKALGVDYPFAGRKANEAARRAALMPRMNKGLIPPAKTCQWIDGKPSADDSCKCGEPNVPGWSYCEAHLARAYQRSKAA